MADRNHPTARKFGKNISHLAILGFVLSSIASCSAPIAYQQYAQNHNRNQEIDATDFHCPTPRYEEYGGRGYRQKSGMVGRAAPSNSQNYSYAPAPPPPPPPPAMVAPSPMAEQRAYAPSIMPPPYPMPPMPPAQDTERYPHAQINGFKQVAEQPISTFAMENDTASYSNARRFLNEGRLPPSDAIRVEEFLNYFHYDYPVPHDRSAPFSTSVAITPSPWSEGKQIVHIGLQGYDITRAQRQPLNLVLLMDVSGSMMAEDRLPLAKRAVRMLLPQLNGNDHVSMVVYAGASGVVLEPTRGNATRDIVCALEALQAGGSTAGAEGIRLAYKMAEKNFTNNSVNRVVLMTDGDFNVGITDPNQLRDFVREGKDKGIYLSVFGFGRGNYNDTTMQALAQNGNGTAAYIDTLSEARRVFGEQFNGAMFPIANDVKAQIEFNPNRVAEWRLIGYETRALNREDFNNDKIDAGEIGSGHQVTALYEITPKGGPVSVDPLRYQREASPSNNNGEIAFLRLRYKLPGQSQSRLIERPITNRDMYRDADEAPNATKLAISIAAFAQKLRNDPWIGNYDFSKIKALARTSLANDRNGQIDEFVGLINAAENMNSPNRKPID